MKRIYRRVGRSDSLLMCRARQLGLASVWTSRYTEFALKKCLNPLPAASLQLQAKVSMGVLRVERGAALNLRRVRLASVRNRWSLEKRKAALLPPEPIRS